MVLPRIPPPVSQIVTLLLVAPVMMTKALRRADGFGALLNLLAASMYVEGSLAAQDTCPTNGRATRACTECPWRVAEPVTEGTYTLLRTFDSVASMRSEWLCYMGGTDWPADNAQYEQGNQGGFHHTFGRGYFYGYGPNPANFEDAVGATNALPWLKDPTNGLNSYRLGCAYKSDLLVEREDRKPGFSMRAMRVSTASDVYTEANTNWQNSANNDIYTLRLESKDIYNGGLFGISVSKMPWGAAAWPAFWMVGSEPNDWAVDQPRGKGLGLRNYWPYRGEIDIIEYVNSFTQEDMNAEQRNHVTLHEPVGCFSNRSSPSGRGKIGADTSDDCAANNAFTGCSMSMGPKTTGAPDFQGGIYICEWLKLQHVKCWFFKKDPSEQASASSDWTGTATSPDYGTNESVVEPFNFTNATTINVADLGEPDVLHLLSERCQMYNSLADMRLILNTVICGQWAGAVTTNAQAGDPDGFSFVGGNCSAAFRSYMQGKPKSNGNRDYLGERWDWTVCRPLHSNTCNTSQNLTAGSCAQIDWIKVWT